MALSSYRIPFLIPYFVEIQRKSFLDFLNIGLISELSKKNPIYDSLKEFKILFFPKYYQLSLPNYTPKTAILKFQTYKSKLYIPIRFTNCKTKKSKLQWIFLAELPLMTKRGNFVINGAPRIIINQIVRSPGIYYKYIIDQQKRKTYYADLISQRGAWLRFEIDKKNRVWIQMKKTRKIPILIFFKALGISNFKIRQTIKYWNFLENSKILTENIETENYSHPETTKQSLLWIYTFVYPQKKKTGLMNLFSMKKAKKFLFRKFFSERTYDLGYSGRLQLNKKFNLSIDNKYFVLTCQDLLFIADYLLKLQKNTGLVDDIDHLKNRKVRTCGELIQNQFATGLIRLEKLITDKTQDFNLCISEIFTSKPVDSTLRQFFNSSPLSQFMDQTNPLAELTHKRRISSLGPGGISRETAGMDVRGIHPSHYGRICPIETPEGRNAGLVNSLTTLAKINSSGLIETPFFKVFKGQIQTWKSSALFSPRQEQYINLAPSDLKPNYFLFLPSSFIFTKQNDKFKKILRSKIEYIAVSVIQMISIATSLIPFLEHDDANRALMGSNMQRQAVPLILAERPIIGTGLEARVISDSGHGIQSKKSGKISYISSKNILMTNLQSLTTKSPCEASLKKSEIFLRAANFKNIFYKTNNNIFIGKKKTKLFFKKKNLTSYTFSKNTTKTLNQTLKNKSYSKFLHYKKKQSNLIQSTFKSVPNLTKKTIFQKKSNNFFSKIHFQYYLNINHKKNFYNWIGFQNCCSIQSPKQFSFLYLNFFLKDIYKIVLFNQNSKNPFHTSFKNSFYNLNFKTYSYLCNTYFFNYHNKLFLLNNKKKLNLIKLNTQKKIGSYALTIWKFSQGAEKPIEALLKIDFLNTVSIKNTIFSEVGKKMILKQCSRKKNRFFFNETLSFQPSFSETHLQSFKKKSDIFVTNFQRSFENLQNDAANFLCIKFWIKNLFPFKIFYNINFSFLKKNYLFREFYVSQTHCFYFSLSKKIQINFYFFYIMKKKSLNLVLSSNFCNNTFTKLKLKTTIKNNFIFYIKQFVILFLHEYSKLIFLQTFIKKKNVKHIFFYTSRNWQNFNLEKFNTDFFSNNKNNKSIRFFKNPNFLGYLLFSGKKINKKNSSQSELLGTSGLKNHRSFLSLRAKINLKQFKLKILKFNSKKIDKYKFFKNLNYFFVVRNTSFILFFQNKTKETLQSCNEKFIFKNYIKKKIFKTYSNLTENKTLVTKHINFQEKTKLFHQKFKQSINCNFFFDTNFVLYKKIFIEKTKLNLHLKYNKRLLYPLTLKKKYIFSPLFNNIIQLTNKLDSTQLFINHNFIESSLFIEKLQTLKTINKQILLPSANLQILSEKKTSLRTAVKKIPENFFNQRVGFSFSKKNLQISKAPLQLFNVRKQNTKPYYTKKPPSESFSLLTSVKNIHQQLKLVNQSNYNFSKKKKINQTKTFNVFKQKNQILNFNLKSQFLFLPQITNYSILTYQHSNQNTCLNQTPLVSYGEWVQKGDFLSDGSASAGGDLALGKSILIAYMPWEGYNFEDAILINERLIYDDLYTSIHIEKYKTEICDTPYGLEKITADIPNVSYKKKLKLDSKGIIKIGSWVTSGDILVGKITPIQKKRISGHEKLLADILEKKNDILTVRDTSLRVPKHVSGRIVHIEQLENDNISSKQRLSSQRKKKTNARSGSPEENFISFPRPSRIHIYIAEKRKIQVGDKMSGRHGNKGIISNILPRQDMPYLADGTTIDMVLNPLGVPSRMNVGQIFECLLGLAANELNEQIRVSIFDEMNGFEATRSLAYSKLFDAKLKTGKKWLFNSNFPGKMTVFDGRTGENFKQTVTVGKAYMLKLVHLVDEKIHARSTGPYSLVTQQPVRGRSKHGGQRLGEMEVWALEGFGAAYILQELLTTKSDDIKGRHQVMQAILQRKSFLFGTPESFKVLLSELQSLCLNIGVYSIDNWGIRKKIDIMQLS